MTTGTKTPALPQSRARRAGPVPMAQLRKLAAALAPQCHSSPPDDEWLVRTALDAMRPAAKDTVLALVNRWLEGLVREYAAGGHTEEAVALRALQRAVRQAQQHGIVAEEQEPSPETDDDEAAGYQAARDYFEHELHTLAEQYLKDRGDDDGLRAGILLLYADHTALLLNEAHTSLRYAIQQEMETTGRVDPRAVKLLWTVAEALEGGHAMTFDGVGWVPKEGT